MSEEVAADVDDVVEVIQERREVEISPFLNLGCGADTRKDWHDVDHNPDVNPNEVVDLEETPWPWPDDYFWHIEARHVLEHLGEVPWTEIQRVLRPGGSFSWVYPIGHTRFEDGSHKQFWNVNTAEWVVGEREHDHEAPLDMYLVERTVEWSLSEKSILQDWRVRYRLRRHGPGPWMGQVTGLYGEMDAVYRLPTEGER